MGQDYTKEYRDGYTVKSKGAPIGTKLPFFCPYERCRRATDTMDDKYLKQYGICANCYVLFVENRKKPLIDTELYRQRLQQRGY